MKTIASILSALFLGAASLVAQNTPINNLIITGSHSAIPATGTLSLTGGTLSLSSGTVTGSAGIIPASLVSGASAGTVVSLTSGNLTPLFNVTVSNPTTAPTLTFSALTQSANLIYAGPTSGGSATPSFRALVSSDIPSLSGTYFTLAGPNTATGSNTFSGANAFYGQVGLFGPTPQGTPFIGPKATVFPGWPIVGGEQANISGPTTVSNALLEAFVQANTFSQPVTTANALNGTAPWLQDGDTIGVIDGGYFQTTGGGFVASPTMGRYRFITDAPNIAFLYHNAAVLRVLVNGLLVDPLSTDNNSFGGLEVFFGVSMASQTRVPRLWEIDTNGDSQTKWAGLVVSPLDTFYAPPDAGIARGFIGDSYGEPTILDAYFEGNSGFTLAFLGFPQILGQTLGGTFYDQSSGGTGVTVGANGHGAIAVPTVVGGAITGATVLAGGGTLGTSTTFSVQIVAAVGSGATAYGTSTSTGSIGTITITSPGSGYVGTGTNSPEFLIYDVSSGRYPSSSPTREAGLIGVHPQEIWFLDGLNDGVNVSAVSQGPAIFAAILHARTVAFRAALPNAKLVFGAGFWPRAGTLPLTGASLTISQALISEQAVTPNSLLVNDSGLFTGIGHQTSTTGSMSAGSAVLTETGSANVFAVNTGITVVGAGVGGTDLQAVVTGTTSGTVTLSLPAQTTVTASLAVGGTAGDGSSDALIGPDGTHPTVLGHQVIAQTLAALYVAAITGTNSSPEVPNYAPSIAAYRSGTPVRTLTLSPGQIAVDTLNGGAYVNLAPISSSLSTLLLTPIRTVNGIQNTVTAGFTLLDGTTATASSALASPSLAFTAPTWTAGGGGASLPVTVNMWATGLPGVFGGVTGGYILNFASPTTANLTDMTLVNDLLGIGSVLIAGNTGSSSDILVIGSGQGVYTAANNSILAAGLMLGAHGSPNTAWVIGTVGGVTGGPLYIRDNENGGFNRAILTSTASGSLFALNADLSSTGSITGLNFNGITLSGSGGMNLGTGTLSLASGTATLSPGQEIITVTQGSGITATQGTGTLASTVTIAATGSGLSTVTFSGLGTGTLSAGTLTLSFPTITISGNDINLTTSGTIATLSSTVTQGSGITATAGTGTLAGTVTIATAVAGISTITTANGLVATLSAPTLTLSLPSFAITGASTISLSAASGQGLSITNSSTASGASAQINVGNSANFGDFVKLGTGNTYKFLGASGFAFLNNTAGRISILNDWVGGDIALGTNASSTPQWTLDASGNVTQTGSLSANATTVTTLTASTVSTSGAATIGGALIVTGSSTLVGTTTIGSGSANFFELIGSATDSSLLGVGSSSTFNMIVTPKGNGRLILGTNTWAKSATTSAADSLTLDNGGSDTPNVTFYYANNKNYSMDVVSGVLRFIADADESTGAVIGTWGSTALTVTGSLNVSSTATVSGLLKSNGGEATTTFSASGASTLTGAATIVGATTMSNALIAMTGIPTIAGIDYVELTSTNSLGEAAIVSDPRAKDIAAGPFPHGLADLDAAVDAGATIAFRWKTPSPIPGLAIDDNPHLGLNAKILFDVDPRFVGQTGGADNWLTVDMDSIRAQLAWHMQSIRDLDTKVDAGSRPDWIARALALLALAIATGAFFRRK